MGEPEETREQLLQRIQQLEQRLAEAESTLSAIRYDEVDALVVSGSAGPTVYTLRSADHPYRLLVQEMQEGALIVTPAGLILYANEVFAGMVQMPLAHVVGSSVQRFVAPQALPHFTALFEEGAQGHSRGEVVLHAADGTPVSAVLACNNLLVDNVQSVCIVVTDLTTQKHQEALTQANATLEQRVQERTAILEVMQDITRAANEASSSAEALQFAVDRLCAYMSWPVGHAYLAVAPGAARWAPTAIWHLEAPERFAAFQEATQTMEFAAGEGMIGRVGALAKPEWGLHVTTNALFHRRCAALEAGLTNGFAVPILAGSEVAGVLEFYASKSLAPEPTMLEAMMQMGIQLGRAVERERAATQAQHQNEALLQREKLAAMGTLLANVAHELNNPLSAVMMQADLLREEAESSPLAIYATEITQAAERCVEIVQNFLSLARQQPPKRTRVALNTVVEVAMKLFVYPLRVDSITVESHFAAELPLLWADPHQLQQVVVNLVTNAHQAMRETAGVRQMTLTTRMDPVQQRVILEVEDTGPGIPPAVRARLFEPFFTTKPPGVGTGLGLPLCLGIIERHGGTLSVESTPGHGAVFRVELPLEPLPVEGEAPAPSAHPVILHQTILVVDDELGMVRALARLLRRDGYTVETAANGRLALAKCQDHDYDLILCDLRMPELDGPGFYQELARRHPHLCQRMMFLTGDTLSPEVQVFLDHAGVPRLTKPFTAAMLRQALAHIFAGERM